MLHIVVSVPNKGWKDMTTWLLSKGADFYAVNDAGEVLFGIETLIAIDPFVEVEDCKLRRKGF